MVYFGHSYDFTQQRLERADAIPDWLRPLASRIEDFAKLRQGSIAHALVTEYDIGAGIGWHRDKKQFDKVFGLSLLSHCPFRFRRRAGASWKRFTLDARPRSLYVLDGEARRVWEHSIAPVDSPRYSITFRTMRPPARFFSRAANSSIAPSPQNQTRLARGFGGRRPPGRSNRGRLQ
ncbi:MULTISPECIES: alpha-ketoglutarate-dependent dioxygenase AlkB [Bradyrhizobium]|uniref:alpha-ketoglutarate-dependent dioxygenase AlkB n=1 Tax=Bradyrhizobium TaxID=374 RepID=UPI00289E936A|nr:alpha-ketoglutarate-dependent dioxygenase AlkB [Bradyrhizobium altum]